MSFTLPFDLQATLSDEARANLAWLKARVKDGLEEIAPPAPGWGWRVTLRRRDGRGVHCYAGTPDAAIAHAREFMEGESRGRRR